MRRKQQLTDTSSSSVCLAHWPTVQNIAGTIRPHHSNVRLLDWHDMTSGILWDRRPRQWRLRRPSLVHASGPRIINLPKLIISADMMRFTESDVMTIMRPPRSRSLTFQRLWICRYTNNVVLLHCIVFTHLHTQYGAHEPIDTLRKSRGKYEEEPRSASRQVDVACCWDNTMIGFCFDDYEYITGCNRIKWLGTAAHELTNHFLRLVQFPTCNLFMLYELSISEKQSSRLCLKLLTVWQRVPWVD